MTLQEEAKFVTAAGEMVRNVHKALDAASPNEAYRRALLNFVIERLLESQSISLRSDMLRQKLEAEHSGCAGAK